MDNEFGPDKAALSRIAQLEEQLRNLQTVVLILVARTSDDPAQAKRLAERIYDL